MRSVYRQRAPAPQGGGRVYTVRPVNQAQGPPGMRVYYAYYYIPPYTYLSMSH